MHWIAVGGAVVLSAAAGVMGQVVRVPAEHVRVTPWAEGGGVAGDGNVVYRMSAGGPTIGEYASNGLLIADDIRTVLAKPALLDTCEFMYILHEPLGVGSFFTDLKFFPDVGGQPDTEHPFGELEVELDAMEDWWIITIEDIHSIAGFELPVGGFWFGIQLRAEKNVDLIRGFVGGVPDIGSSQDLLFQADKGLFDFGGDPVANIPINLAIWEGPPWCYGNCSGIDGLDLFDFLCFQNKFNAQDPYADCNDDGAFDLFDFLCFQNAFIAGC